MYNQPSRNYPYPDKEVPNANYPTPHYPPPVGLPAPSGDNYRYQVPPPSSGAGYSPYYESSHPPTHYSGHPATASGGFGPYYPVASPNYDYSGGTSSVESVRTRPDHGRDEAGDPTARLMEEFIRKCNKQPDGAAPLHTSRTVSTSNYHRASPSVNRRKRSLSRESRDSRGSRASRTRDEKEVKMASPSQKRRYYRSTRSRSRSRDSRRPRKTNSRSSSVSSVESSSGVQSRSKREEFLDRWRMNNCASSTEASDQLEELSKMTPEDIIEKEKHFWTRTAPADLYYVRSEDNPKVQKGTEKLLNLCDKFQNELVKRAARAKEANPEYVMPPRKGKIRHHKCCRTGNDSDSSDSGLENGSGSGGEGNEEDGLMEELERKKSHPHRLHPELWYNDPGEMNDGPLCRCSNRAKRSGIRHNIYAGELNLEKCDVLTNNADRLFHYRITVSPPTNFLIKTPTIIEHDNHEYIFEGFSMFSHKPLENLPVCKVIRFNIEYTILYIEEKLPEHFIIKELDLFYDYLFKEILELVDLDFKAAGDSDGCSQFHFMPRFVRELPENGKELLSMNEVLQHLLSSAKPLIPMDNLKEVINLSNYKWQNYVDEVKGMVVTYPGKKPCSLRVDQLDRDQREAKPGETKVPEIVHFGIRPPQLSYAGNPEYQKAWREYVKFRHLLANMPKASYEDKRKLESKENKLQEMRTQSKMKRDVTIAISAEGFYRTGIMCDIVQHAMLIPVLVSHLRFHRSLDILERDIEYIFINRSLLQLALTHPSYRENFGTNPDHARNSLTNCSIRQPLYGDRKIHYLNTRKRGINTLINIMSRFGKKYETESNITHNERLEFLGDAVVEFVTSIHLFHLFPRLEEGGLATYRAAIVQNQHLAVLAKKLGLEGYMLYAHGSDLCHDLELRHAMANCFEALMGALFLDGGIEAADKVFGETLFKESEVHLKVWVDYPPHPLQEQEPNGDRQWIKSFKILQELTKFEDSIGVQFTHIRLLARAFTDRSIGFTNLTLGSNQRLEFLGDTVLQLIASDYLYKYFPEHHEGHLSLLRSSLVNNKTQAVVCDDLGIAAYAIYANPKGELKTKDRADLLEAFLGALYVDKGLLYCETFCNVCFFPRLQDFIMHQDWNDPKSKLQQCCLTLRTMEGGEPDIPTYKVIECMGPTNTRLYTVAVYFKGKRLAQANGHSIQQAEMNAAKVALENSKTLFPQLDHQKRVIAKSIKQEPPYEKDGGDKRTTSKRSEEEGRGRDSAKDRRGGEWKRKPHYDDKTGRHQSSTRSQPRAYGSRRSHEDDRYKSDRKSTDEDRHRSSRRAINDSRSSLETEQLKSSKREKLRSDSPKRTTNEVVPKATDSKPKPRPDGKQPSPIVWDLDEPAKDKDPSDDEHSAEEGHSDDDFDRRKDYRSRERGDPEREKRRPSDERRSDKFRSKYKQYRYEERSPERKRSHQRDEEDDLAESTANQRIVRTVAIDYTDASQKPKKRSRRSSDESKESQHDDLMAAVSSNSSSHSFECVTMVRKELMSSIIENSEPRKRRVTLLNEHKERWGDTTAFEEPGADLGNDESQDETTKSLRIVELKSPIPPKSREVRIADNVETDIINWPCVTSPARTEASEDLADWCADDSGYPPAI
ncbi:ribonuclease III [Nesidiocoris tenuis]|uniref:Ribonuclease III n=1 Tax=Nesidiocoris tenuis TaxID=355587 RepID=A0ABN7AAE0_9HEMI|nr:ribonuclease III [Nesidiocoris tenuis]